MSYTRGRNAPRTRTRTPHPIEAMETNEPAQPLPARLPRSVDIRWGWTEKRFTIPAGTPLIPATNLPAGSPIVAWADLRAIPNLPDGLLSWAQVYGVGLHDCDLSQP